MTPPIRSYRDLVAWQKGMALADGVGKLCELHAGPGLYSMTDQLQRAADSIPANIAEGYGRFPAGITCGSWRWPTDRSRSSKPGCSGPEPGYPLPGRRLTSCWSRPPRSAGCCSG